LADLHAAMALIRRQPGNEVRRRLLRESSEEPWSAAERLLHRLLREAGIEGWRGNARLSIGANTYVVDILFRAARLVIEVDGRHFHGEARFESDRWRQNALVLDGWRVLRFTWAMLERYPDRVVAAIEKALAAQSPSRRAA
jgi:very-short-patch-repair endonuclease